MRYIWLALLCTFVFGVAFQFTKDSIQRGYCEGYWAGYSAKADGEVCHCGYDAKDITKYVGAGNESGRSYWWSK